MSDQDLRAKIKTRLTALGPGIGRVHDYERWAVNPKEFLLLFQDPATKKIFGWEITRPGFRTEKATMAKWKVTHRFVLKGYYGLEDDASTEKTFQALVDAIALDFLRTRLAGTQHDHNPEAKIETKIFGHVLCHVAEIRLEAAEIVERLPEAAEDLTGIDLDYYLTPGDDLLDAADTIDLTEPE